MSNLLRYIQGTQFIRMQPSTQHPGPHFRVASCSEAGCRQKVFAMNYPDPRVNAQIEVDRQIARDFENRKLHDEITRENRIHACLWGAVVIVIGAMVVCAVTLIGAQ